MVTLCCPVRACARPLIRVERSLRCDAGHSHDLARRGYANLLQPQDKKSADPGDRKEAVEARRRTAERGLTRKLIESLSSILEARLAAGGALLDVGCGDGFVLDALACRLGCDAWGVDISREAVEFAARHHPGRNWLIANGDRKLPFADGAFRAVISVTGPKNPDEFRRLVGPDGVLIVVVSGPDDQAELREALLGEARPVDRAARVRDRFDAAFEWEATLDAIQVERLDRSALRDLLDGAYRGVRHTARRRFDDVDAMTVTLSHRLVVLRPRVTSRRS